MAQKYEGPAMGIDLGTTYSCVGVWRSNRVEIIPNEMGNKKTPSYVAFSDTRRLIGEEAMRDIKRLMGRRSYDNSPIANVNKPWPFKVEFNPVNHRCMVLVNYKGKEKPFSPEEISSMILMKMREIAEAYLGTTVMNAVISVPAHFNTAQRQATMDAGVIAGLKVMRLINEPSAAALAYGFDRKVGWQGKKNILVFDLGGGTLDVSLLKIEQGTFTVMSTAGDTYLGGEDFEETMVNYFIAEFKKKHKVDIRRNFKAVRRLRAACEKAKIMLSVTNQARIQIDCLHEEIDFSSTITRDRFVELNSHLLAKCKEIVDRCLMEVKPKVKPISIDEVLLVGGSTRIPMVQDLLRSYFRKEPCKAVNADEAVAYGATIQAAMLSNCEGNRQVPRLVLEDVTPLDLRVLVNCTNQTTICPKNTAIPPKHALTISFQEGDSFDVYEDRHLLRSLSVGYNRVLVRFVVDENGIWSAFVRRTGTNQETKIVIPLSRLREDEIQRMAQDAKEYNYQDTEHKKKVEKKNFLENYIYYVRKAINNEKIKAKLDADDKQKIETAIEKVITWLTSNPLTDVKEYEERTEKLKHICNPILSNICKEAEKETDDSSSKCDDDSKSSSSDGATSKLEITFPDRDSEVIEMRSEMKVMSNFNHLDRDDLGIFSEEVDRWTHNIGKQLWCTLNAESASSSSSAGNGAHSAGDGRLCAKTEISTHSSDGGSSYTLIDLTTDHRLGVGNSHPLSRGEEMQEMVQEVEYNFLDKQNMEKRMAYQSKAPAIGIHLGTTYTCVGVWLNNVVEIIADDLGNRTTPTCIAFNDEECLIGEPAKHNVLYRPSGTIFEAKRLIGRRFSDETVQNDVNNWPFKVIAASDDKPMIVVQHKGEEMRFFPEQVSAMVLEKMRKAAETYLRTSIKDAVVTVPAYFNDAQRQATRDACTIAGLKVMGFINEPTAAAIAYGFHRDTGRRGAKNVLIFDLGGRTFDVSLLSINKSEYRVKATRGNTHLGGKDIDNRMAAYFVQKFKEKHNEDISGNHKALTRLRMHCEMAKRHLSTHLEAKIKIECLYQGIDCEHDVTRSWFEQLNSDLCDKCLETVDQCLKDANMEKSSVHDIVLVGGSTRIPMIQQLLKKYFDGKELCRNINPEEATTYGAAIQAAILNGDYNNELRNLAFYDVTPLSLGIKLQNGVMSIVVPRNTTIPVNQLDTFWTSEDNQTTATFSVYQGERAKASENYFLGAFQLKGIPPAPRGEIAFNVCFNIDVNGKLMVSAQETSTGVKNCITIINDQNRLSAEQIQKMVEASERCKLEDDQYRKKLEERNALQMYANKMRSAIKNIDDMIEETLNWLKENNDAELQEITAKMEKLRIICKPIDGKVKNEMICKPIDG